jgi:hypothetical protein
MVHRKLKRVAFEITKALTVFTMQGCGIAVDAESDPVSLLRNRLSMRNFVENNTEFSHVFSLNDHPESAHKLEWTPVTRSGKIETLNLMTEDGISIYGAQSKRVLGASEHASVMGNVPSWKNGSNALETHKLPADEIKAKLAIAIGAELRELILTQKIYFPSQDNGLIPAYLFRFRPYAGSESAARKLFHFSADLVVHASNAKLLHAEDLWFAVDGVSNLFAENAVVSGATKPLKLPDLLDGTRLISRLLRVLTCNDDIALYKNCRLGIRGFHGEFQAPYDSPRYDETNAYYSMSTAMEQHRNFMGEAARKTFADFGLIDVMDVFVRARSAKPPSSPDNAFYSPDGVDGSGVPAIVVGTGWEPGGEKEDSRFHRLGKNADVFFHEFGHHIVFRSIKSREEQSGGLHEGYSDYFAYAMTNNNRLAEGSGVGGGNAAVREGSMNGLLSSIYIADDIYSHGAFWASTLWETRKSLGKIEDYYVLDGLVWDSISYLPERAGYYQAIVALNKSLIEYAKIKGIDLVAYRKKIVDIFTAKGYLSTETPNAEGMPPPSSFLASIQGFEMGVGNKAELPKTSHSGELKNKPAPTLTSEGFSLSQKKGCGIIAQNRRGELNVLGSLFLIAMPLVAAICRSVGLCLKRLFK